MPHPDEGLIHAWLDGELDAAEAARVEALVASDPEWTAAAAEARGLTAASARIVGSLDRVPANVIPRAAAAPPRAARRWMLRAAAILVLIGGSAVVVNRSSVNGVTITIPLVEPPSAAPVLRPRNEQQKQAAPADLAAKKVKAPSPVKEQLADSKSTTPKQELDEVKKNEAARDKNAGTSGELRAKATIAAAGAQGAAASNLTSPARRADAPPAAPVPAAAGGSARAQGIAMEKSAAPALRCFVQRAPADSASRIIRLDAAALADSIRLERLTLRGDTLAAVNGKLIAVLVRCPVP